jgi:hypothetical protein
MRGAGVYAKVRTVLDVDRYYYLATENIQCYKCGKRMLSWSPDILKQLDPGHRSKFTAILTSM